MSVSVTTTAGNSVSVSVNGGTSVSFTSTSTSVSVSEKEASQITVTNKGPKGDTGATGATGATGPQGPAGSDGTSPNAFTTLSVAGQDNVVADATDDTLTLAAGSNVTITTNASSDTVTIASTDTNTQLSTEAVQDIVGGMFSGNTETRISATYQDADGTIDLEVDAIPVDLTSDGAGTIHANNVPTLNQSTTGNAGTATALATARAINGVNFDGTAAITVTAAGSTLSDTVPVSKGGTGATSLSANSLLTGDGSSAISAESNLTFDGSKLLVTGLEIFTFPDGANQFYGEAVNFGSGPAGVDGDIVQAKLYYLDSSQQWEEADADAASTSSGMLGIAVDDDTARFLVRGFARNTGFGGLTTGDILYVSTTSGAITNTAPSGNGDIVRVVGYCVDGGTRVIYFDPDKTFVEVTA